MPATISTLQFAIAWAAIIGVNIGVAHQQGRDVPNIAVLSLFFAPAIYLYLLAVGPKHKP
jgi:hypothetical protein